jgi:hypothetical protein
MRLVSLRKLEIPHLSPLPLPRGEAEQMLSNSQLTNTTRRGSLERSDVAPAPLKLLPDDAEKRRVGQRGQWKRSLCFANGDD